MSWKNLLQSNSVHRHTASRQELSDIRRLVARDLTDAEIPAFSEDRRFATAYNAALQTAKTAIAYAGYRIASMPGHHRLTFQGAKLSVGKQAEQLADTFGGSISRCLHRYSPRKPDSSLASGVTFGYLIRNSCRLRP
jgi:hypothetical protein